MIQRTKMSHKKHERHTVAEPSYSHGPVLKLRQLAIGIGCVIALIMWPMFMVWKQIYISNVSVREAALSDSLATLAKEVAALRLYNERLSSTRRIESIMRENCGLEYPVSEQIVVVMEDKKYAAVKKTSQLPMAVLKKKPVVRERG